WWGKHCPSASLRWHYPDQVPSASALCGRRTAPSQPAPPRELPTANDVTEALALAPGRRQEVREDAIDLRVQRQADMAAVHLDRVDVRAQAGLPVDDAVRARVDRGRRHAGRSHEVADETHLDRGVGGAAD